PGLRPAAPARPQGERHVLRQPRPRARLPGHPHELHRRARDAGAPPLRGLPPLARLRGRGEGARPADRATTATSPSPTSTSAAFAINGAPTPQRRAPASTPP